MNVPFSVILVLLISVLARADNTCPAKIVTSLHQKNCTDKATEDESYYLDKSSCIPKCTLYSSVVDTGKCDTDSNDCTAGYVCESRCGTASALNVYKCETHEDCSKYAARGKCVKVCILPDTDDGETVVPCMAYHANIAGYADKWWKAQKFKPECDDSGEWVAKQCKGGLQGRCLCYSSTGVRLFGEALYTDADDMTCACSRRKSDLESGGRNYVTLHCDSKGNYEEFQCDVEKSLCWCAEPLTGEVTAPFVPMVAMKKLPCYSEDIVGSQYLRQCESKKFATAIITAKLKTHGVVTVEADTLVCDADGSYGNYMIDSGNAYCVWRDNSKIGTWQANLAGTASLTCNCARDFKRYGYSLSCEGTGDYVTLQYVVDSNGKKQYYCVDQDGFAKSGYLDDSSTDCALYY